MDEIDDLRSAIAREFDLVRELGRGGMGVVVLARDRRLDRLVAIKFLPAHASDDSRTRFLREARTAAQLSHPNIIPIHGAADTDGRAYFIMGYVDGESLAERVAARGPLPPGDVIPWLRDVAWALAYAHARGVIHRDVKPENILVERATGRAIVTDFGIARDLNAENLTATGNVLGTVHYMSPEQSSGDALDGRSDLYALGVVAFYLLSGRLPFDGLAAHAVLVANVTRPAPALCAVAPNVPQAIGAVVDRCLAKNPDARYASGEALAEALSKALDTASQHSREEESRGDTIISERAAEALWRRAAQLQAETLSRIDTRRANSALVVNSGSHPTPGSGHPIERVRQAAVEAGISAQFIDLALAEMPRNARGAPVVTEPHDVDRTERHASMMLGTNDKSFSVTRVIHAPPARVLRAMGSVWRAAPWSLMPRAPLGGHPLDSGVLVFDLPPKAKMNADGGYISEWYHTRNALEATQLQVTMRALSGDAGSTEVTVFCDLRPGIRRNVYASGAISGLVGAAGSLVAATVTTKTFAVLSILAVGIPAVSTGLGLVGLTVVGYRMLYRAAVRWSRAEIEKALEAIEGGIQSDAVFGSLLE
ncbi:MAG: serine/threonine-protein kinase [Gemmatimonadota bacterium]